jgi:ABC-type transport system substrate-binding protein
MTIVSPVHALITRPAMNNVLIHVYANPDAEFLDFELGTVELTDWPATKYWLDRWRIMPQISLRSYSELGMQQFDLNNQRWPCGWDTPTELDPDTASYKHYMDLSDPTDINSRRDYCASEFRKALTYLTDKDSYVRNILGGLGYAVRTFCPIPALEGYTNYADLATKGYIYYYNPATAAQVLDAAGFQDWDSDGSRDDWKDPGEDLIIGTGDDGAIEYNSLRKYNADGLVAYTRMDDPNRNQAGILLCTEMQKLKIPVKIISTERTVCWRQAMVLYDYDIYTGGWSLGATPEWLHTIFNSEYYWSPIGWSSNYMGWSYKPYDAASFALYSATTTASFLANALLCQELIAEYSAVIPLWCMAATKGFSTSYANQPPIADVGYGVDNYYSFALMNDTPSKDRTIDYGFKSDIEGLHVICSEWLWDWNAIGLVYEPMIGRKPYDKAIGAYDYWLATGYTIGTWGTKGYTEVNFTIRTGVLWQDGVAFTPADVVFSLEFTRHCGKGVAWNFAAVQYLNSTWAEGNKVIVRMNIKKPLTGQEDPGMLPIIPKHIWEAKYPNWQDWFDEATGTWQPFTPGSGRAAVRDWKFWEENSGYSGVNGYVSNATGTGAWIFDSHTVGQYIAFHANKVYYRDYDSLLADVKTMFWAGMGDANKNMKVDGPDLTLIHACWSPAAYDPNCDFNNDLAITGSDYKRTNINYGRPG